MEGSEGLTSSLVRLYARAADALPYGEIVVPAVIALVALTVLILSVGALFGGGKAAREAPRREPKPEPKPKKAPKAAKPKTVKAKKAKLEDVAKPIEDKSAPAAEPPTKDGVTIAPPEPEPEPEPEAEPEPDRASEDADEAEAEAEPDAEAEEPDEAEEPEEAADEDEPAEAVEDAAGAEPPALPSAPVGAAPPLAANRMTDTEDGPSKPPEEETEQGDLLSDDAAEKEPFRRVTVYYATDREKTDDEDRIRFGGENADALTYGTVEVSIPTTHKKGDLETPRWWKLEFKPDPAKHVAVLDVSIMETDPFFEAVKVEAANADPRSVFVFVHGFNTPFDDAARRTAQIHHDLEFAGAPLFYSWPSKGELTPFAYNQDAVMAERTAGRLAQFLQDLKDKSGAERIHLIAHSMGNRALTNALVRAVEKAAEGTDAAAFDQIILAAPDIDREVFLDLAKRMGKAGAQVTLYASARDQALKMSKTYHGYPRAGDCEGEPVIADGVATIDAGGVSTDVFSVHHDFYADEVSVLTDIRALMETGAAPDAREGLEPQELADGRKYWRFRVA